MRLGGLTSAPGKAVIKCPSQAMGLGGLTQPQHGVSIFSPRRTHPTAVLFLEPWPWASCQRELMKVFINRPCREHAELQVPEHVTDRHLRENVAEKKTKLCTCQTVHSGLHGGGESDWGGVKSIIN